MMHSEVESVVRPPNVPIQYFSNPFLCVLRSVFMGSKKCQLNYPLKMTYVLQPRRVLHCKLIVQQKKIMNGFRLAKVHKTQERSRKVISHRPADILLLRNLNNGVNDNWLNRCVEEMFHSKPSDLSSHLCIMIEWNSEACNRCEYRYFPINRYSGCVNNSAIKMKLKLSGPTDSVPNELTYLTEVKQAPSRKSNYSAMFKTTKDLGLLTTIDPAILADTEARPTTYGVNLKAYYLVDKKTFVTTVKDRLLSTKLDVLLGRVMPDHVKSAIFQLNVICRSKESWQIKSVDFVTADHTMRATKEQVLKVRNISLRTNESVIIRMQPHDVISSLTLSQMRYLQSQGVQNDCAACATENINKMSSTSNPPACPIDFTLQAPLQVRHLFHVSENPKGDIDHHVATLIRKRVQGSKIYS
ncbi:hypothetical protein M514_01975 [Trichuris suis]|uniref:Uncharacterized protein n=1 Tax=Trichuris suis TaxID=68888 RepID=A0A085MIP4_9BILA|nr:hypothetical protein M513_01975 [Trichuris suis]KFD69611.1 hypothetical protein M514_01975 [Trichuris suis]